MKRSQITSHIIFFLIVIIVAGVLLLFLYRFVSSIVYTSEKSEIYQFQKSLKNDIDVMAATFGTQRKFEYKIPMSIREVCIVDSSRSEEISRSKSIKNYPLIEDSIKSNNVFLMSDELVQSFFLSNVRIKEFPYFVCIRPKNSNMELYFEGTNDGAFLKKKLVICEKIIDGKDTVLESFDSLLKLTIEADSVNNPPEEVCLSIEPSGVAESDSYVFKPSLQMIEGKKAVLEFQFSKSLGCPQILGFEYIDDDGSRQPINSREIDCSNNIVKFYLEKI